MYLNITDSEKGNNKDSSGILVHYLDKENRIYKPQQPVMWFNGQSDSIQSYEVKNKLDNNIAKLCKTDSKFFLININPSQKEIIHLKDIFGDNGACDKLKEYAIQIMNEYAKNFQRKDINSEDDLLWFGKLEHHRYYSHKDKEVKSGQVKRGTAKPGEQMHIQVIVSRKDITNKIKLSPMNKSRGRNIEHSKKLGQFNRVRFKESGERLFDFQFEYNRPISETFKYSNAKGNFTEILKMHSATVSDRDSKREVNIGQELKLPLVTINQSDLTNFLNLLLDKQIQDPVNPKLLKKKRKKKQVSIENDSGLHI